MADHKLVAHFPDLEFESPQAGKVGFQIRKELTTEIQILLQDSRHLTTGLSDDVFTKDGEVLIQKMTTMWRNFQNKGTHIVVDIFSHLDDPAFNQPLIQKFTSLAEKFGAQNILHNGVKILTKGNILSVAEPAIEAVVNSVSSYQNAAEKIQPFVESKEVSPETARDYAAAVTQATLINYTPIAADPSLAAIPLAQWVHEHPEVPNKVLEELGLKQIREVQKIMDLSAPEMS